MPSELADAIVSAETGLSQSHIDSLTIRRVSLLRWTVDARRLALWRRETTEANAITAIDLILTPPDPATFESEDDG